MQQKQTIDDDSNRCHEQAFQDFLHKNHPLSNNFFGFLGFGLYDTAAGIINIIREIAVVDALGNALPGGRLVILVQPVSCTVEGKLCILCAAFDTIFTQQFVPHVIA